MRTVNYQNDIIGGIAHLLGIDPTIDLGPDRARQWNSFVNNRAKEAWRFWDWPELRVTEERAFRSIWNSTKTFKRVGASGQPDELFYIPTFLYYKVLSTAPGDPPVGTVPTNTTYFTPLPSPDQYVDLDQDCRQAIGEVIGVYTSNPLTAGGAGAFGLPFRLSQRGVEIGPNNIGGGSVFVTFKIRAAKFTSDAYDSSKNYAPGDVVFWSTGAGGDGNCYRNRSACRGTSPSSATCWAVMPMPERLAEFVKLGAASDASDDLQTSAKLASQAREMLMGEVDSLVAQGDVTFYQQGDSRRRIWIPLGVSGFWWSVSAPWTSAMSSSTTTLVDSCVDDYGAAEASEEDLVTDTGEMLVTEGAEELVTA